MADYEKNDTLTGVCNSALAMAGHTDFIADIASEDAVASTCRALVEQVVKEIQAFEYGVWDELYTDVALVRKGNSQTGIKRRVAWNLPFDMLAPVECYRDKSGEKIPFEITGGYLLCNEEKGVWLRYVRFSMNPSEWSVELRSLVIRLLSARIISALVKDYKGSQSMEMQFWQFDYPLWTGNKKNKNSQHDYKGNDGILTQNFPIRGQGFVDSY